MSHIVGMLWIAADIEVRGSKIKGQDAPSASTPAAPYPPTAPKIIEFSLKFTLFDGNCLIGGRTGTFTEAKSFSIDQRTFGMTENSQRKCSQTAVEMRRQMTSRQMKRFVGSLSTFSVDPTLPEGLRALLRRLDNANDAKMR